MKTVTRVAQEMVMSSGEPLKAIASKIGKPYPTLLRELNPYDKGAKLGVETLLALMQVTKDYRPLQYMADSLGLTLVPQAERACRNGNGAAFKTFDSLSFNETPWELEHSETGS